MKFSIYMNPQTAGPEQDVDLIETSIRQAVKATEAGFVGVGLTEHHFSEFNTYSSNIVMAAHLAGVTAPDTKFLLAAVLAPLHNPVLVAEQLNLLDVVSRGRVIVALASGGDAMEFVGLGRDPENRLQDFQESLAVMKQAFAKEKADPPLEWSTRFETGTIYTRLMPSGYRRSHPPLARTVIRDEAAREAGLAGEYFFTARITLPELVARYDAYRSGLAESGLTAEEMEDRLLWSFCQRQVIVRETDEEARAEGLERIRLLGEYGRRTSAYIPGGALRAVIGPTSEPEEFLRKQFITGSPDTVRAELQRYADAGIPHLALHFNFSFMTAEESDSSLDLFLAEVLPTFREAVPQLAITSA